MSDARTAILSRIERALRTGRIPDDRSPERLALHPDDLRSPERLALHPDDIRSPERVALRPEPTNEGARAFQASGTGAAPTSRPGAGQAGGLSAADRFILEARALGVEVFVESSPEAVRERLGTLTAGKIVLAWDADRLPYEAAAALPGAVTGSAPIAEQAPADAGVTGCHGAIAETGSLALISGPGCSRTVSLLPPLHIAVVRRADLFATMGEFFAARHEAMARAANCTFVTGPSRTADIELSLTIGVHGPGKVAVILGP